MKNWENKKAIGILRKSSRRQEGNSSFDIQEKEIREYCLREKLEIIGDLQKITESAMISEDRKKYDKVIKDALDQGILHFVYYMQDRESRNLTDIEANEKRIRSGQIVVHYARDRKVLDKDSPDSEFFVRDINAAAAKQFSRNLSVKVKDAMRQKAEEGWFPANHVPLGYLHRRVRDESGREVKGRTKIEIDTNSANINLVRREFELRAEGMGYEEIRRTILAEGLLAGTKVKQYYMSGIERRLNNKFYRGYFDWDGIEYHGKHPLIIPQDVVNIVQSGKIKRGWNRKERGVFAGGWIRCADPGCGCALVYDGKSRKLKSGVFVQYHYYRCTNAKYAHSGMKGRNVTEEKIFEQFRPALKSISIDEDLAEQIKAAMDEITQKHRLANKQKYDDYRKVLTALDEEQDEAYRDLKKGVIPEDQYQRIVSKVKENRSYYTGLIEKCSDTIIDSHSRTIKNIIELSTRAESLWNAQSAKDKVALLRKIVSNPVLDGPTIRYDLQKPFAVIAKMREKEEWRPLRDSNSCLLRERELS
jgi:DNA invertase Pin-like site-specific DNA recombinase